MARLQVLYLPTVSTGDHHEPRFGLVADQCGDLTPADCDALRAFAAELGARGCLIMSGTVDLDQGDDEADEALAQELQQQLKAMAAPAQPQKQKLPPPNTLEGRMARVWGGEPPTEGTDPR